MFSMVFLSGWWSMAIDQADTHTRSNSNLSLVMGISTDHLLFIFRIETPGIYIACFPGDCLAHRVGTRTVVGREGREANEVSRPGNRAAHLCGWSRIRIACGGGARLETPRFI